MKGGDAVDSIRGIDVCCYVYEFSYCRIVISPKKIIHPWAGKHKWWIIALNADSPFDGNRLLHDRAVLRSCSVFFTICTFLQILYITLR